MSKWIKKEERLSFTGGKVCVYGHQGSGKCVTRDTLLLTEQGYKTLEDVFEDSGHKLVGVSGGRVKSITPTNPVKLINRFGKSEIVKELQFNGMRKINQVLTKRGKELKITSKHPLLVLEDGVMIWKHSEDIKVGDYLVSRKGDNIFGVNTTLTPEEAYAWGIIIADGYTGDKEISVTNSEPEVLDAIQQYFYTKSGTVYAKTPKKDSSSFKIADRKSVV